VFNLIIARAKKPPVIKFMHMARVTFGPPTIGAILATIPVMIAAGTLKLTQNVAIFDNTPAEWKNQGQAVDETEKIADKRGRLGLQFVIIGFV